MTLIILNRGFTAITQTVQFVNYNGNRWPGNQWVFGVRPRPLQAYNTCDSFSCQSCPRPAFPYIL